MLTDKTEKVSFAMKQSNDDFVVYLDQTFSHRSVDMTSEAETTVCVALSCAALLLWLCLELFLLAT